MRKLVFGVIALMAACSPYEAPRPAQEPIRPTPAANVQPEAAKQPPAAAPAETASGDKVADTIKGLAQAVNAHDADKMASHYANDATVTVIPGAGDVKGRAAIAADQKGMFTAFPDLKMVEKRSFRTKNAAIVEWVVLGTHTGNFMNMPATNKPIGQISVSVYELSPDGLIQKERVYSDGATLLSQVSGNRARPIPGLPDQPEQKSGEASADEVKKAEAFGKQMFGTWEARKVSDYLGLLHDDFEFDAVMAMGPEKGKQSAKQAFERFGASFPDQKYSIANTWAFGDHYVYEYAIAGTHKGPIGPLKPTNKPIHWHWVQIVQVKDGKVARGWGYANMLELFAQLGALRPAAPPPAQQKTPPPKSK
jgi:steroid delta-isomerase-like uncharacterized protein